MTLVFFVVVKRHTFLSWLTDRIILEPSRREITVPHKRRVLLSHADGHLEAWVHRVGAVDEFETGGVQTTLPFHAWLLTHPEFTQGRLRTDMVARDWDPSHCVPPLPSVPPMPSPATSSPSMRRCPMGRIPGPVHRSDPRLAPGAVAMSDHRGHYRMRVEGLTGEPLHRDPAEVGSPGGRQPEVRVLAQTVDDRAAGVHRYETSVDGWVFEVAVEDEPRALLREKAGQAAGRGGLKRSDTIKAQIPDAWCGSGSKRATPSRPGSACSPSRP